MVSVCVWVCGNSRNQLCVMSQSPPFQFISSTRKRWEGWQVCVSAHACVYVCVCVCVWWGQKKEKEVKEHNATDRRRKSLLRLILNFRDPLDLETNTHTHTGAEIPTRDPVASVYVSLWSLTSWTPAAAAMSSGSSMALFLLSLLFLSLPLPLLQSFSSVLSAHSIRWINFLFVSLHLVPLSPGFPSMQKHMDKLALCGVCEYKPELRLAAVTCTNWSSWTCQHFHPASFSVNWYTVVTGQKCLDWFVSLWLVSFLHNLLETLFWRSCSEG